MIVEYFGEFARVLEIDTNGVVISASHNNGNHPISGTGLIVDGAVVAAYCKDGRLFVRLDSREWGFPEGFDALEFRNDEGGVSSLILNKCGVAVDQRAYRSWWLREESSSPAGFGDSDDQEHDIGAYLAFMFAEESRRSFLVRKWCR